MGDLGDNLRRKDRTVREPNESPSQRCRETWSWSVGKRDLPVMAEGVSRHGTWHSFFAKTMTTTKGIPADDAALSVFSLTDPTRVCSLLCSDRFTRGNSSTVSIRVGSRTRSSTSLNFVHFRPIFRILPDFSSEDLSLNDPRGNSSSLCKLVSAIKPGSDKSSRQTSLVFSSSPIQSSPPCIIRQ